MEAWVWVLVVAVVALTAALVWLVMRQRQRERVLAGFGPEYDRAVEQHGDRRAAERDLVSRARQREKLEIKPLSQDARDRYNEEWRTIQTGFVDQPETAITEADALLDRVLRDRGYPVDDFDTKAQLVSVDHPEVISNYREARAVQERNSSRLASTEDLRGALLRYRSLFEELLVADPAEVARAAKVAEADVRDSSAPKEPERREAPVNGAG